MRYGLRRKKVRRCFSSVDPVSDCSPTLLPIDKEPNHQGVQGFGLGKTERPADQPLEPRAHVHRLALDLLAVCLPHLLLRSRAMPFVGPPPVGERARAATGLQQRLAFSKDGGLPPSAPLGSPLAGVLIKSMPSPAWRGVALDVAPHLGKLGAELTPPLQRLRPP